MTDLHKDLKALGSQGTAYTYAEPSVSILETFPNPLKTKQGWHGTVNITCPEFTSLCPKTGQPDFAKIVIEYLPDELCVESKSLKLYLGAFRMVGEFHETCVQRIADDLVAATNPKWLRVTGEFTPRGGIPFWPSVFYQNPSIFIQKP
jgi:7-cyano-7-deazaguanine reductase